MACERPYDCRGAPNVGSSRIAAVIAAAAPEGVAIRILAQDQPNPLHYSSISQE